MRKGERAASDLSKRESQLDLYFGPGERANGQFRFRCAGNARYCLLPVR